MSECVEQWKRTSQRSFLIASCQKLEKDSDCAIAPVAEATQGLAHLVSPGPPWPKQLCHLHTNPHWGLVQFSCSLMSNSLRPHVLQHTRLPCPSPPPRVYWNSCPSSLWCHPTISSYAILFSPCLQSFPASGSFPMSPFFASSGQSIRVPASASVLPVNIQDWFPLGWTDLILQSFSAIAM